MFVLKIQANQLDAKLKGLISRVRDLTPAMQDAIDITNESVLDEFSGAYYLTPSGGRQGWHAHVPFGSAKRGRLLWNRGRLKAAMTGGAGSKQKVSQRSFSYGIEANKTFAVGQNGHRVTLGQIVSIHRGGLGPIPNQGQVTVVRAKETVEDAENMAPGDPRRFKMYWKLRRAYGVRLSRRKLVSGLRILPRPFAAASRPLKDAISVSVKNYILGLKKKGRRR